MKILQRFFYNVNRCCRGINGLTAWLPVLMMYDKFFIQRAMYNLCLLLTLKKPICQQKNTFLLCWLRVVYASRIIYKLWYRSFLSLVVLFQLEYFSFRACRISGCLIQGIDFLCTSLCAARPFRCLFFLDFVHLMLLFFLCLSKRNRPV